MNHSSSIQFGKKRKMKSTTVPSLPLSLHRREASAVRPHRPHRILSPGGVSSIDSDPPPNITPVELPSKPESLDPLSESRSIVLGEVASAQTGAERCKDLRLCLKGRDWRSLTLDLNPEVLCESSVFFKEMVKGRTPEIEVRDVEDLDVFWKAIEL